MCLRARVTRLVATAYTGLLQVTPNSSNKSIPQIGALRRQTDRVRQLIAMRLSRLGSALALALLLSLLPGVLKEAQAAGDTHEAVFIAGPSFNVGQIQYPASHDFDLTGGTDTCLSLSVPPADTFTLSLEWLPLNGDDDDAGDLDLYIYLDSACTESALLTSSFNSNSYTGELVELTPRVRNIGDAPAVAGVRIGKRSGHGAPGTLTLKVASGEAFFLEHSTSGAPLPGQEGAPAFVQAGPYVVAENSPVDTVVGTINAIDDQTENLTYFELEPAEGQTTFDIDPGTGEIVVEDPTVLDRESVAALTYWIGVTDGSAAALTSVHIVLSGVNDMPPSALDTSGSTAPGVPVVIQLSGLDLDIDPVDRLDFTVVTAPVEGTVGLPVSVGPSSAEIVYSAPIDFTGTDEFTFVVSDGETTSDPATVTVEVTLDGAVVPTPTPAPASGGAPAAPGSAAPPPPPGPGAGGEASVPPSVPRAVRAEAGDRSVAFTWQRPLEDGGVPIEGYRIFNVNTAASTLISGDVFEGQVLGLENGIDYLFQVRAYNAAGFGPGALVGPVTPVVGTPAAIDLGATLHPDDTVTLWWLPPEGDRLKPIVEYNIWSQAGELLDTVDPGGQLIATIDDLKPDAFHEFRITAVDEEGGLVATGVSEPVYMPPTLAMAFDPMPVDAVLVPLESDTRLAIEMALREIAGGAGMVADEPAIMVMGQDAARIFIAADDLLRGLEISPAFIVESEQLEVTAAESLKITLDLRIAPGISLHGTGFVEIDPTGVLFTLELPQLQLAQAGQTATGTAGELVIGHSSVALRPGFVLQAELQELELAGETVPADMPANEAIAIVEVKREGVEIYEGANETVEFRVASGIEADLLAFEPSLSFVRIDADGENHAATALCEQLDSHFICSAQLPAPLVGTSLYVISRGSSDSQDNSTPEPAPAAASPVPTATTGPSLVVVQDIEPDPEPTAQPVEAISLPTPTPAPSFEETIVPETGGGVSAFVTWLMSGVLTLVMVRGAFYAVGRLRA